MPDIPFYCDNDSFASYCQTLKTRSIIALDTEFLRVYTFYPKPGLFQINDGEQIVLVDPCAITQWQGFIDVLADPGIVKVLHACNEDIEVFYHFLKVKLANVFDTQVAAAFCGYDYCMGYQRLLKAMLDVDLEKGHSRSDWMQRPLDDEQILYAADDVRYLMPVYETLSARINERGLQPVLQEEYENVLADITSTDFSEAWQRIKEAWKLEGRQFAVLKVLATWREEQMRARNMPRKRIADDGALMQLASHSGWTMQKLYDVSGLPAVVVRRDGEKLMAIMADAFNNAGDEKAPRPVRPDSLFDRLKKQLGRQAQAFGVEEKMLVKKPYTEAVYRQLAEGKNELPENIIGWRRPLYQQAVIALLQG